MRNRLLLFILSFAVSFASLYAQTPDETDLDLKYAADLLKPGTPAPDFTLNDIAGNPVKLSDFKGRQVVLQFWASWCPDCRAEMPLIKQMQERIAQAKEELKALAEQIKQISEAEDQE